MGKSEFSSAYVIVGMLAEHAEITSRHANAMQDSIEHIEELLVKITKV